MRGEFSVTAVEAKNEQVPIAEGGVVVVEAVDGGGFVTLHRSDCTGQHRLRAPPACRIRIANTMMVLARAGVVKAAQSSRC